MDAESRGEYVTVARQISTSSERHPNSYYRVSGSFAFAVSKTQGGRTYWKTRSVKYFLYKMKNNLYYVLILVIVKDKRNAEFYTHVVATTPQDRSSRCRIRRYVKSSFPSMRTVSFLGVFTSGNRSVCLNSLITCKTASSFL